MSTPLIRRPESNGASTQAVPEMNRATAPGLAEYVLPATSRDLGAQAAAVLGLLTGVWVALSPWFLTPWPCSARAGSPASRSAARCWASG
jgi:hypothetical protein